MGGIDIKNACRKDYSVTRTAGVPLNAFAAASKAANVLFPVVGALIAPTIPNQITKFQQQSFDEPETQMGT